MPDAQHVANLVPEKAVAESGEVEQYAEAITNSLNVTGEAGLVQVPEIPCDLLKDIHLIRGSEWLPCHACEA